MMVAALCCALEGVASAQGMLVGSIGKVYGGDTLKSSGAYAIAVGGGGAHSIGSELEFSRAGHFTDLSGNQSKVLSLMASIFVSVPAGPVKPYALFGYGFIRQRTETSTFGVTYRFSRVAGVRADLRHFKVRKADGISFQRFSVGIVLGG